MIIFYQIINFQIKEFNLSDKNYFLSYFRCEHYYNPYILLLKEFGFTRSLNYFGEHNLFLCAISQDRLNQNKIYKGGINKFQKVFRFLNSQYIFQKNNNIFNFFSNSMPINIE